MLVGANIARRIVSPGLHGVRTTQIHRRRFGKRVDFRLVSDSGTLDPPRSLANRLTGKTVVARPYCALCKAGGSSLWARPT